MDIGIHGDRGNSWPIAYQNADTAKLCSITQITAIEASQHCQLAGTPKRGIKFREKTLGSL